MNYYTCTIDKFDKLFTFFYIYLHTNYTLRKKRYFSEFGN